MRTQFVLRTKMCRRESIKKSERLLAFGFFGTRNGNRTHNYPLGGGYYIHLTMQAYFVDGFIIVSQDSEKIK